MNNIELMQLVERYPKLEIIKSELMDAFEMIITCYENDGKILIAGNGGSAADAEHIVGELMKSFRCKRPIDNGLKDALIGIDKEIGEKIASNLEKPLRAIALTGHEALSTAYINDVSAEYVYAQQLLGYGKYGDVFIGITTSGNSANIINAAVVAKALGMKIVGMTGEDGGILRKYADVLINVPEKETYLVQELHLPVYHWLCMEVEKNFFGCHL